MAGTATLIGLVDVDGDGFDEVIDDDRSPGGAYVQKIYWQDGAPKVDTLAGDGL